MLALKTNIQCSSAALRTMQVGTVGGFVGTESTHSVFRVQDQGLRDMLLDQRVAVRCPPHHLYLPVLVNYRILVLLHHPVPVGVHGELVEM